MNHKELDVWKKSMDLVELLYHLSNSFPDFEKFGLTSQVRRAAVSIPSNIAEGAGRKGNKEFIQFLGYSKGSVGEVRSQLYRALDRNHINETEFKDDEINYQLIPFWNWANSLN